MKVGSTELNLPDVNKKYYQNADLLVDYEKSSRLNINQKFAPAS